MPLKPLTKGGLGRKRNHSGSEMEKKPAAPPHFGGHRYQNINWSLTRFGCGSQSRLWLQGARQRHGAGAKHVGSGGGWEEAARGGAFWAWAGPSLCCCFVGPCVQGMGVRECRIRSGHPCGGEEGMSIWECRVSAAMCWVLETLPACLSSTRTHRQGLTGSLGHYLPR